jgi:curved DNA-binding protein
MPHLGAPEKKGDLYAKVRVVLPTTLSSRERELFQELKQIRTGAKAGAA